MKTKHNYLLRFILPALVATLCWSFPSALIADEESLAEATAVLGKEKSLSEGYVGLLETIGKGDPSSYAVCIRHYAIARSEFNGFIEGIKTHVIEDTPIHQSESFQTSLDNAVDGRRSFTTCVDKFVDETETTKSFKDYISVASELVKLLLGAGIEIWKEFRSADSAQREAILEQLNELKWESFADLTSPG